MKKTIYSLVTIVVLLLAATSCDSNKYDDKSTNEDNTSNAPQENANGVGDTSGTNSMNAADSSSR